MVTREAVSTLRPRQNGRHFADNIFKCIFLDENVWIPIKISMKFVSKGPMNNIAALVQIMAWRRAGDKTLSEPMPVVSPTHICVTRPQWVKHIGLVTVDLNYNGGSGGGVGWGACGGGGGGVEHVIMSQVTSVMQLGMMLCLLDIKRIKLALAGKIFWASLTIYTNGLTDRRTL